MDSYHIQLGPTTANCGFHEKEKEILGQIILGCTSQGLWQKVLKDILTLTQLFDEAHGIELSESRAASIVKNEYSKHWKHIRYSKPK